MQFALDVSYHRINSFINIDGKTQKKFQSVLVCTHLLYTFLPFFQDGRAQFIALKCNVFENTPQVDLRACKNQSSDLYSVTAFR